MTTKTIKAKNKPQILMFDSFISRTYGYMFSGLLLTALVAFLTISTGFIQNFFTVSGNSVNLNILGNVVFYAPFLVLLVLSFKRVETFSLNGAKTTFFGVATIMGFMMSILMVMIRDVNIVMQCLLGTSAVFAGSALIGHYIKKDLSMIGRIAYNMFWGVIIVSAVSALFGATRGIFWSYIVIALSSVMVAYTQQSLKVIHSFLQYRTEESDKIAIFGALTLYVDFINIFINLLNIANRK